jgi:hypothetical protein
MLLAEWVAEKSRLTEIKTAKQQLEEARRQVQHRQLLPLLTITHSTSVLFLDKFILAVIVSDTAYTSSCSAWQLDVQSHAQL